jgi:hypothetical protein
MSFGMNERLVDFRAKDDFDALMKAANEDAEYCVRCKKDGSSMYTVMPMKSTP